MKFKICLLLLTILFFSSVKALSPPTLLAPDRSLKKPYVLGILHNQLGNQLFEIAAAVSLALDHDAEAIFPQLKSQENDNIPLNYKYVFWRLNTADPETSPQFIYNDPDLHHKPIPYHPNMALLGAFQSEKYFLHHKKEILELFEPHKNITRYLNEKHEWLKSKQPTVAVHVRAYWPYFPGGAADGKGYLPFLGYEYFEKAILSFPKEYFFVIFSNNIKWCKENLTKIPRKMKFIEGQPHYLDLFLMSLCTHHIISNSSFSWWGAYLNKNPSKIVVAPKKWFTPECGLRSNDIIPEGWVVLE